MAANKNAAPAQNGAEFDWLKYVPQEYQGFTSQLEITGGLIPMWLPNTSLDIAEEKDVPVVGFLDRLVYLPTIERKNGDIFEPLMAQVELAADFPYARTRNDGGYTTVKKKAGELIYIPMSGNLKNNKDVMYALQNPEGATFMMMRVKGRQKTDQPTPMTVIETVMIFDNGRPKTKPRTGRLALPFTVNLTLDGNKDGIAQLPSGAVVNAKTGEVQENLLGVQAQA